MPTEEGSGERVPKEGPGSPEKARGLCPGWGGWPGPRGRGLLVAGTPFVVPPPPTGKTQLLSEPKTSFFQ